jgi:hypothetical protein
MPDNQPQQVGFSQHVGRSAVAKAMADKKARPTKAAANVTVFREPQ